MESKCSDKTAHARDDLNRCIFRLFEDTILLCEVQLISLCCLFVCLFFLFVFFFFVFLFVCLFFVFCLFVFLFLFFFLLFVSLVFQFYRGSLKGKFLIAMTKQQS